MMRSEDLKRMINAIPDGAVVLLNGNPNVDIVSIKIETTPFDHYDADLGLTKGFSIVKDDFVNGLYDELRRACESKG